MNVYSLYYEVQGSLGKSLLDSLFQILFLVISIALLCYISYISYRIYRSK